MTETGPIYVEQLFIHGPMIIKVARILIHHTWALTPAWSLVRANSLLFGSRPIFYIVVLALATTPIWD